ncbi:ABC transporter ATP-binding protein [Sessilibacter corallicola]|uniref:ABC transporter ATP-binding protein n=1 Tax=Sessilibacter corallicola TaxID=2904075 RepID=A0ABQ0A5N4_9GAMM|nr:ABC transporter ATP-binding protein [Sessilibacter corallicola]MCE2027742.1 ABC transporter ATP-binding protein [Sessilibacter corallicola]
MTAPIVKIRNLKKSYRRKSVVDIEQLDIQPGRILGFIGPNGAGKTTTIRCLLGLARFQGELEILGKNPYKDRQELLRDISFIADTAVLPKWITSRQLLDYLEKVHPNFNRHKAEGFLAHTDIAPNAKVSSLSKGMTTQLHLALVISIDAKLLLLDEPTLGLDIIYRQKFYEQLLNDFFDETRTVLITTHQVEEIETILTDIVFINRGKIALNLPIDDIGQHYSEVVVAPQDIELARSLKPINERKNLGDTIMLFENQNPRDLEQLGTLHTPSLSNLFVAKFASNYQSLGT